MSEAYDFTINLLTFVLPTFERVGSRNFAVVERRDFQFSTTQRLHPSSVKSVVLQRYKWGVILRRPQVEEGGEGIPKLRHLSLGLREWAEIYVIVE